MTPLEAIAELRAIINRSPAIARDDEAEESSDEANSQILRSYIFRLVEERADLFGTDMVSDLQNADLAIAVVVGTPMQPELVDKVPSVLRTRALGSLRRIEQAIQDAPAGTSWPQLDKSQLPHPVTAPPDDRMREIIQRVTEMFREEREAEKLAKLRNDSAGTQFHRGRNHGLFDCLRLLDPSGPRLPENEEME